MPSIHPTAVVSGEVQLESDVEIGPWCVVSGAVKLGAGVRLLANVHLSGPVAVGAGTVLYPFACVGFPPQDYKFKPGMPTAGVRIGTECLIREHATIHAATKLDVPTRIGNRVFLMVGAHAGHDCRVDDEAILVNNCALGGHAEVHSKAIVSGCAVIHQFNRVGKMAVVSGGSAFSTDVPPYCMAWGRNDIRGINVVGLRRSGLPGDQVTMVRRAFREVLRHNLPREETLSRLDEMAKACPPVAEIAEFIRTTKRGISPARRSVRGGGDDE